VSIDRTPNPDPWTLNPDFCARGEIQQGCNPSQFFFLFYILAEEKKVNRLTFLSSTFVYCKICSSTWNWQFCDSALLTSYRQNPICLSINFAKNLWNEREENRYRRNPPVAIFSFHFFPLWLIDVLTLPNRLMWFQVSGRFWWMLMKLSRRGNVPENVLNWWIVDGFPVSINQTNWKINKWCLYFGTSRWKWH